MKSLMIFFIGVLFGIAIGYIFAFLFLDNFKE